jgi:hypothetical protein
MLLNPALLVSPVDNDTPPIHDDNAERKGQDNNRNNESGKGHDISPHINCSNLPVKL